MKNKNGNCDEVIDFLEENGDYLFASKKELTEKFNYLLSHASDNDGYAQYWICKCYHNGIGVKINYFKAFQAAHKSASCGYVKAYYALGHMYRMGNGVARDKEKALEMFKIGMDMGDEECFKCYNGMLKNENVLNAAEKVGAVVEKILPYIPK